MSFKSVVKERYPQAFCHFFENVDNGLPYCVVIPAGPWPAPASSEEMAWENAADMVYTSNPRPTKNEYNMWLAVVASTRSTCNRRSVGCVIVSNVGRILATGYNGSSPNMEHCDDVGHLMLRGACVRTTHAEANAIGHAARCGTAMGGSVAYVTCHPCPECLKLMIATGIWKIVYLEEYHADKDSVSSDLAGESIVIERYDGQRPWESAVTK